MNKKEQARRGGMQKSWRKPECTRDRHQMRTTTDEQEAALKAAEQ